MISQFYNFQISIPIIEDKNYFECWNGLGIGRQQVVDG
jgi:hypothetical protein